MATCTGDKFTQQIERTECIGNSLNKINSNFSELDKTICSMQTDIEVLSNIVPLTSLVGISPVVITDRQENVNEKVISITNATAAEAGLMSVQDKNKLDGLTQGVPLASFIGTNQFLALNGYQKIPGGLTIQWGTFATTGQTMSENPQIIPLNISFSSAILFANVSVDGAKGTGRIALIDWSTTNKTNKQQIGVYSNYSGTCKYFAIGY